MDRVQIASKMAGEWWAKQLADKYADRRPALANAVAQRVADELNGVAYWNWRSERCDGDGKPKSYSTVECDYEPMKLLASAVGEVFHDMEPWQLFSSIQDLFPQKYYLRVTREALHQQEGYGNWLPNIPVPE